MLDVSPLATLPLNTLPAGGEGGVLLVVAPVASPPLPLSAAPVTTLPLHTPPAGGGFLLGVSSVAFLPLPSDTPTYDETIFENDTNWCNQTGTLIGCQCLEYYPMPEIAKFYVGPAAT